MASSDRRSTDDIADPDQTEILEPDFDVDSTAIRVGLDPEELTLPPDSADFAADAGNSPIGMRMVEIAISQIGVCESGQNDGIPWERYVKPFGGAHGQPWCAYFVSWCYWQTTSARPGWQYAGAVASVHDWAQAHGRLVSVPLRGDMFGIGSQHMGLVSRSLNSSIYTVEGNTSSGCVKSNERPLSGMWYARPM